MLDELMKKVGLTVKPKPKPESDVKIHYATCESNNGKQCSCHASDPNKESLGVRG